MPDHRQKKLEKKKKRRANVSRSGATVRDAAALDEMQRRLVARFRELPMGPCFVTRGWRDASTPRLHCVVATRRSSETVLAPVAILVDLGCEGVRDAFLMRPAEEGAGVQEVLALMQQMFPQGFEAIEPVHAATLVQRAIDYAAKLDLHPSARALEALRVLPDEVDPALPLELGRDGKPLYSPQPGEDTKPVVQKLVRAVGPDGFSVMLQAK